MSTLTGDEPAEEEGGGQRVPEDADSAEGVGRLVPPLAGAGQAGEQRQDHPEDPHHDQVDGDEGLARAVPQVDRTCPQNSRAAGHSSSADGSLLLDSRTLQLLTYRLQCWRWGGRTGSPWKTLQGDETQFLGCFFSDSAVTHAQLQSERRPLSSAHRGSAWGAGERSQSAGSAACLTSRNVETRENPKRKKMNECRGQSWGNRKEKCVR